MRRGSGNEREERSGGVDRAGWWEDIGGMEGADGRGEGRCGGAGPHVEGGRGRAAVPGEREAAGGGRGARDGGAAEWGRRENVGHPHGAAARGLRAAHRVLRGGEEQLW